MMNVMIDLETMGSGNKAAIVSIGAVVFENIITDKFYCNVDLESSMQVGLTVDASTIEWWLTQPNRGDLLPERRTILTALYKFRDWLPANPIVWGNGATFDNVIIRNAFNACGIKCPWAYKNDRCFRTMKNMYPKLHGLFTGIQHNALNDAVTQAIYLMEICSRHGVKL
jgi:DNA polymerase III epsilon subunit-like protein